MDSRERLVSKCTRLSVIAPEAQKDQMVCIPILKEEILTDDEDSPCSDSKDRSEPSKSSDSVNYLDGDVLEQLKEESPEDGLPQSDHVADSNVVSEEISRHDESEEINHENISETFSITVKVEEVEDEGEDVEYQFTLEAERQEQRELVDTAGPTSTHYDVLAAPKEVQCKICDKTFTNSLNLLKHNNEHIKVKINTPRANVTKEVHQCRDCDKRFDNHDDMLVHISDVHVEKPSKCDLCGKQFKSVRNLERHNLLSHKPKKSTKQTRKGFKCKHCNVGFKNRYTLYVHNESCRSRGKVEGGKHNCETCGGVYKSKQSLVLHIKRIHCDYGRTFDCWCGEKFRSPVQLSEHNSSQHKRGNKKNERHKCGSCDEVFNFKQSLAIHMKRVHCDYGRMYECQCGKEFRTPMQLSEHKKRKHSDNDKGGGSDKFQCGSCQKCFTSKQHLVEHVGRYHYEDGKLFECWCGEKFRLRTLLYAHKKEQHAQLNGDLKFSF